MLRSKTFAVCYSLKQLSLVRTSGIFRLSTIGAIRLLSSVSMLTSPRKFEFCRNASTTTGDVGDVTSEDDTDAAFFAHVGEDELSKLCDQALEAAIKFVPKLGWSREALEAACAANNLPSGLHTLAMPKGGVDLVMYFYESRNHQLAEQMAQWRLEQVGSEKMTKPNSFGFSAPPPFTNKQETDAFLCRAIKTRLLAIEEVLPFWPQAMGLLALPSNCPGAIGLEAQLVDEIWAQAGDMTVDLNWYAKRLGLAYVYKLTELFYIKDASANHEETWRFLDRRIADLRAMKEAKVCENLKGVANMLRESIFAAGHVTSNILGWNPRD